MRAAPRTSEGPVCAARLAVVAKISDPSGMRGLATPIGSVFRLPFVPPTAIQRLPFNLLRDDSDPRRRARMQAAVEHYQQLMSGERQPAQLMPQRMLFQMHKTNPNDPNFGHQPWDNSALSYYRLVHGFRAGVPTQIARALPPGPQVITQATQAAAQRGGARMPQPPDGEPYIINRAVRVDGPNSSFRGRSKPPPGGVRRVGDIAQAIPISANARVVAALAQTLSVVRR